MLRFDIKQGTIQNTLCHFEEIPIGSYFTIAFPINEENWSFVGNRLHKISQRAFTEHGLKFSGERLSPTSFKRCIIVSEDFIGWHHNRGFGGFGFDCYPE